MSRALVANPENMCYTFPMIPQDPVMLLSYINMKLRDEYPSLEALADDLELDEEKLKEKLRTIGCEYDEKFNKFQ